MPTTLHHTRTPHGTEVLIEPLPHVRSCSLGFWVRRGSCHERAGEEGLAHFIEHTVFKGTASYPTPDAMAAATDRLGGHLDAFTGKESACFYGKVLREELPALVHLLGELVTVPRFEPEELGRERQVILEEIAQSEDTPDDWASELFYSRFWEGSPLAHPILGTREQVASYGTDEARAFFAHTYTAPNLLVTAAGDVDPEGLLELLMPILDRLPAGAPAPNPELGSPRNFVLNAPRKDLQQVSLVMGFPTGGHTHPDRVALSLLSNILGGGMSSRLFMELRENQALCYQVGSFLSFYTGTGALQISASCDKRRAREFVQRTLAECLKLREQGLTADELDRAKRQARTSLVFGQESTTSRMFSLAHQTLHHGRTFTLDEQLQEIEAVDVATVHRVARDVLRPETFGAAALGTVKGAQLVAEDWKA